MQTEFPERYITLGLKIAYYRKKAGMTQEVLAERIGKSVNCWSGRRNRYGSWRIS